MLKVTSPIIRETTVIDPDTGKPIVIQLYPSGHQIGVRVKKSKQTYTLSILDLYRAARSAKGEDFTLAKHVPKKEAEPDITDEIKSLLKEHDKLHFSQVRQQLKGKGIEISKRVASSLLKLMDETGQIDHEGMYYHLAGRN